MYENIKQAGPFFRQLLETASMREVISATTLKTTNDVATNRFLSQIPKMSLGIADAFEQNAMNPKSANNQQRSGDYENLYQIPRSSGMSGITWTASCKSGGSAVVGSRDKESLLCFWRKDREDNTRCEFVSLESAVRKACAD